MLRKSMRLVALSFLLSQSIASAFLPALPFIAFGKAAISLVAAVVAAHPVAVGGVAVGATSVGTYETIKRIFRWFHSNNNQHQE